MSQKSMQLAPPNVTHERSMMRPENTSIFGSKGQRSKVNVSTSESVFLGQYHNWYHIKAEILISKRHYLGLINSGQAQAHQHCAMHSGTVPFIHCAAEQFYNMVNLGAGSSPVLLFIIHLAGTRWRRNGRYKRQWTNSRKDPVTMTKPADSQHLCHTSSAWIN